jgi:type II secretion system protein D
MTLRPNTKLRISSEALRLLAIVLAAGAAISIPAAAMRAQPATPEKAPPASDPASEDPGDEEPADEHAAQAPPAAPPVEHRVDRLGRRIQKDEPTILAFKAVGLDQIIPFLVETTGKVVMPQPELMTGRKITIVNDQPIPRAKALDLVIFALQQNGIAVVETDDLILLRDIAEIDRQDVPVLGPDESVLDRTDLGSIYEKVFALHNATAENIHEIVKNALPQFAKTSFDAESNQIVVMGNIGLLQRIERLVNALDTPGTAALNSATFHLQFADATQIAQNIKDLYSADASRTGANRQGGNNPFAQFFGGNRGGPGGGPGGGGNRGGAAQGGNRQTGDSSAMSANLRVTANTQQNSVTVVAEKQVIDQVRRHIENDWDKPLPEAAVVPRVYDLKNSDPVKIRDLLNGLFGSGSSTTGGGAQRDGQGNAPQSGQGVGRLAGQFSFEAIPEASRLVVVAKSPDNLAVIDKIIQDLDQPQNAGLPRIIELKHASSEELSEQLNALLSQEGTLAQIQRQATGLSESTTTASPFAADQTNTQTQQQTATNAAASTMTFWWQRARPPTNTAGASNLVSKIRIVPVWRQNALMIMSPPEYSTSLVNLVEQLDKPGRQVLLKAVIAEISLDDATALGLRWSNTAITPSRQDNAINIGANTAGTTSGGVITGTKNDLLPGLFDTSVLNVGVDLNVLFQALNEKTGISILSEPRIFTSDNQEAEFFNGQDIPFVTDTQTTDNGTLTQSFDYRAVGINLRVRPRITVRRDVDLNINLELSSIQPNQTLFGGFIVDRRETTTHLIIKDGQTVVISGILRSQDSDVKRKVPLLGDLPLIGSAFTSIEKSKTNSEIVAFITPIVIENEGEAETANEPDVKRLGELRDQMVPQKYKVEPKVAPTKNTEPSNGMGSN